MATINGFGLKNIKSFKGYHGQPLEMADITYNGKVVGFYKDHDDGGMPIIRLEDKKLMDYLIETNNKWFQKYPHGLIPYRISSPLIETYKNNPEGIMYELFELLDIEKEAKREMKKHPGYCYLLCAKLGQPVIDEQEILQVMLPNRDEAIKEYLRTHKGFFLARSNASFDLTV